MTLPLRSVAAALLIGIFVGLGVGFERWHVPGGYVTDRIKIIEALSPQAPKGGTVIIGDSTADRVYTQGLCGQTFNASVSRATIADIEPLARDVIQTIQPATVVLAIGTNDLKDGNRPDQFQTRYLDLVADARGRRLVLVGTPSFPDGSAAIRRIATTEGAIFVPPVEGRLTTDRVHQNAAGFIEWKRRVGGACAHQARP